jgi:hypothetical protein
VKLANYCSGFEALLAVETGELTHRLGERISRVLESSAEARLTTYTTVKKAYDIRSRVVHGASLRARSEVVIESSIACDALMRRLLWHLLDQKDTPKWFLEEPSEEAFREHLLRLVLG